MVLIALSATRDEAVTNKTIKISPAPHPPTPRVVHHNPMPAQIGLIAVFITTRPTTERGDVVTDETYRDTELVFQLCIIQCSIQIIIFFQNSRRESPRLGNSWKWRVRRPGVRRPVLSFLCLTSPSKQLICTHQPLRLWPFPPLTTHKKK